MYYVFSFLFSIHQESIIIHQCLIDFYSKKKKSHAFLHGDYLHLAFNMYALWMFGRVVEFKCAAKQTITKQFFS